MTFLACVCWLLAVLTLCNGNGLLAVLFVVLGALCWVSEPYGKKK